MTHSDNLRQQAIDNFWETVPPLWNYVVSHIRTTAI